MQPCNYCHVLTFPCVDRLSCQTEKSYRQSAGSFCITWQLQYLADARQLTPNRKSAAVHWFGNNYGALKWLC